MDTNIIKAIADMLRESNPVTIREVPSDVCFKVEIGPALGGGHTLEEAVQNALEALADD